MGQGLDQVDGVVAACEVLHYCLQAHIAGWLADAAGIGALSWQGSLALTWQAAACECQDAMSCCLPDHELC